jgi:hypothetical protein
MWPNIQTFYPFFAVAFAAAIGVFVTAFIVSRQTTQPTLPGKTRRQPAMAQPATAKARGEFGARRFAGRR